MKSLRLLIPLLIAAAILLAGNGVQGTLIALRGAAEGFSPTVIGFIGSAYFAGFLTACIYIPRLLQSVGHIRTFSALAAITASGSIMLVLMVDPISWLVLRFIMGFCFSGLFATIESWLNSRVSNEDRGRVLSLYRIIDLIAVTGAQFLLPIFGYEGFTLFALLSVTIALSLVPVSLADRSHPQRPKSFKFDIVGVWRLSPIACLGCISIGLTNSAFRLVGPLYAQNIGLSVTSVAAFMSAGIFGGAILQYPLGVLSDRYGRRKTLLIATTGAVLAGLYIVLFAGGSAQLNYIGIFMFGAFALPLYSLSAAHANDHANEGQHVLIAVGLIFFFSLGAMVGPLVSSILINTFGASALFSYTSVVHGSLIITILWRMQVRKGVPKLARRNFVTLLRTSPMMFRLSKRTNNENKNNIK